MKGLRLKTDLVKFCGHSIFWNPRALLVGILAFGLSACTTNFQTKVSGTLDRLSKNQSIAILPVDVKDKSQREAANMFRQTLYANLKESDFNLVEPYLIDGLLKKNKLTHPEEYSQLNPMHLGELLGVDAILISRINNIQRAYLVLHSSIELSVSLQMVDTRTGEILWRAEQTESDFQGLGKIPTGITAAVLAPIYFVTNKLNLNRLTTKMVNKLTTIIKSPGEVEEEKTFEEPVITAAARRDISRLEKVDQMKAQWAQKSLEKQKAAAAIQATRKLVPIPPVTISAGYRPTRKIASKKLKPHLNKLLPPARKVATSKNTLPRTNIAPVQQTPGDHLIAMLPSKTVPSAPLKLGQKSPFLFTIQVGAYKTKAFAENMILSLASKGYHAFLTLLPSKEEETPLYRVQVEKFEEKDQALQLAKKLEQQEHLKSFVTSLNPG